MAKRRPHKPGNAGRSPLKGEALRKSTEALDLRCLGLTYQQIADRVGYCSAQNASRAVQAALKRRESPLAEKVRHDEGQALDAIRQRVTGVLLDAIAEGRIDDAMKAVDRLHKNVELKCRLHGVAQGPTIQVDVQAQANVLQIPPPPEDPRELARELKNLVFLLESPGTPGLAAAVMTDEQAEAVKRLRTYPEPEGEEEESL